MSTVPLDAGRLRGWHTGTSGYDWTHGVNGSYGTGIQTVGSHWRCSRIGNGRLGIKTTSAQPKTTMAAFVFPGSTPPREAPESVMEEVPNPLLDVTNGSLRRRRGDVSASKNVFALVPRAGSPILDIFHRGAPLNQDYSCWVIFENKTNLPDATVQEELGKFQEVRAIRRGAGSTSKIWLIQFKSLVYACKATVQAPGCLRLAASDSEVQTLSVGETPSTTPAVRTTSTGLVDASTPNAPCVWKNTRDIASPQELEESLPCWKILFLWLFGVEEHPARFVGINGDT